MYQETVVKPVSPVFIAHMVSCVDRLTPQCGSLCSGLLQVLDYSVNHWRL